jgi:hypothetical protein
VLTAHRVLGALVVLKAVDVAVRGPASLPAALWATVLAVGVAGGLVLLAGPASAVRLGWAAVLVGGAGWAVDLPLELRRQHLVLVLLVAVCVLVARRDGELLWLWRVQLTALYGVAALAKLNESFLGGQALSRAVVQAPLWSSLLPPPPTAVLLLAGVALIATEVTLAAAPWLPRWRRAGTVLAVCFHTATLLLVSDGPLVALRLVVFGGTAVTLHATSAGVLPIAAGYAAGRTHVRSVEEAPVVDQTAVTQNPEKDPSDWVTGEEPATGPQQSYLTTLAQEAGEDVEVQDITKAEASRKIDELKDTTGR